MALADLPHPRSMMMATIFRITWASIRMVDCGSPAVAAYLRVESQERVLVVQNLSAAPQEVAWTVPGDVRGKAIDLLTGTTIDTIRGKG